MATTATQKTTAAPEAAWRGFREGLWQGRVDVRDFIQQNYAPYEGDGSFLAPATARTKGIWEHLSALFVEERKKGVLDVSQVPSSITAHGPGYIDRDNEVIVGLQTEAPLKRAIMPNGGFRMVLGALKAYGYEPDPHVVEAFTKYRKTHNEGVFDAYTADIRKCRSSHILTGLPDAYGRGRIIGDYRRVALYGVARLLAAKQQEKKALDAEMSTDDVIRDREELSEQIRALKELQQMAAAYGFDVSRPAAQRAGSGPVALLRLPGGGEGAERGRHVARADVDVPRRLLRAGPPGGRPHRGEGTGDRRRLRDQAAHRPLPADTRVRRALRRRPDVGHRVDRGHGRRRPAARHEDELPLPADALQPRPGAGAEPDGAVLAASPRGLPALRREGRDRHELDPVRERRDHPPLLGRRRGDRLLRLADARRQADAVLRRSREPRQVPALRHQRRPRRGERRAGRTEARSGRRRVPAVRRRRLPLRTDDGLARRRLRERDERHPLHARQVRLRAHRDGAPRLRAAAHDGVRHGGAVGRRRQPVGDQAREGEGRARRDRARHRLRDRGRVPVLRQPRQPRRPARELGRQHLHGQAAEVPDVPQRAPHPVDPDHHLERGLREGDGQHAGRATQGRAVRAGGEPHARPRQPRAPRGGGVGREDPVSRRRRRHLAHGDPRSREASAASRRTVSRISRGCSTLTSASRGST